MKPFLSALKGFVFRFRDGLVVVLPLGLAAALAALWGGLPALGSVFDGSLFRDVKLEYPVYADLDGHDNLFVIDKNSRRIVSLTPDGRERWILEGGMRSGGFYESYRLSAVADGGVIAYNFIRDSEDNLAAEEFVRFGSDGEYLGPLVRIDYPEPRGSDEEHLGSLKVKDGFLYYTFQTAGRLELHKRSLEPNKGGLSPQGHETVYSAPLTIDLVSSAPHLPQGVVAADRAGSLFLLKPDGSAVQPPFTHVGAERAFEKPWDLKVGPGGEVYLLDNYRAAVYEADSLDAAAVHEVFSEKVVLAKGRQRPSFEGIAVSPLGTLAVVDKFNHSVFLTPSDGKLKVVTGGMKSEADQVRSWIWVAVDLLALVLCIIALVGLIRRQFADKTSLIIKQILFLFPLVVISVSVGATAIYRLLDGNFQRELRAKLVLVADLGARSIDGGLVEQIRKASDWDGAAHRALGRQFSSILNGNADVWNQDLRTVIYKYQDDRFYFVKNHSSYYGVMFPYGGAQPEHFAAARGGTVESSRYSDEYGTYISGIAPIKTADGRITGILEVYLNANIVSENTSVFLGQLFQGILLVVVTVLLLFIFIDILIFLSLRHLSQASQKLMGGELGIRVAVARRDEIGDLAQDFNTMSSRLRVHFDRLAEVRDANARFVPKAFLDYLNKDSLAAVASGDQVRRRMTVFFADIRSFTSLSEGMTPKENFDFINEYFGVMGPVIRTHGGFIDRYLGDAIQALFPGSPADAVRAGLDMREALLRFNQVRTARGKAEVSFGVGVHTAELTLGVIGDSDRLSVTVISGAVDLVNKLEASTKEHHVGLVMTKAVWDGLPQPLQTRAAAVGTLEDDGTTYELFGL